ncbi:sensor histidine kinase [Carboxylicivirga sp. N1Y90]|uniref:sensor histidine kinase n=1 Tax=Carboxylicivirga fragile TaxID=3417571 RepID=UPI003D3258CC|nr:histidine kinase [Marinilabiliaceae bacterium N1Y90]
MKSGQLPIIFRYRLLWHILFWTVIYLSYVISYGGYTDNYLRELGINAVLMPIRIVFTYFMLYFLLPLIIKRDYGRFISYSLVHALLFGSVIWFVYRYYAISMNIADADEMPLLYYSKIFVSIISNYGIVLAAGMLKLFKWWYIDQQYKVKIENEKLESELKFLKSQINPHFLFNTLNNLYALTLKNSNKASDVVLKLSGLLDYMLYHSKEERVTLAKELSIIENYIELEKIRYGDRLKLSYKVDGDPSACNIAPLILIPFVENAFKHGASNDRQRPEINIKIVAEKNGIQFNITNSYPLHVSTSEKGIGLKNIRRQLNLVYPKRHQLDISSEDQMFKVQLNLNC